MLNLFVRLVNLYWRFLVSPEKYALHIGVKIGKNCFIATREWSSEPYLISIGNNCQITRNVYIHTHGGGQAVHNICPEFDAYGKVTINDWVYIGANSHIMPGVTIGEGCLIAAGSVVTKSVPKNCVVGGNPTKIICSTNDFLNRNHFYNLNTKGKFKNSEEKKAYLMSIPEEKFIKKELLKK